MASASSPILVLDSGLGGLTVIRAMRRALPMENIVYFGDTARVPYGTKSAGTVTTFVLPWLAFEGRLGLVPTWSPSGPFDEDEDALIGAAVRFGKESGIYGAVGAEAWILDFEGRRPDPGTGYLSVGARGGWRFKLGKKVYIAPEAYVGTFYAGAGVHLEWVIIRK